MTMPVRDASAWEASMELGRRALRGDQYDPRRIRMLGMTPRQQELNWKLSWLYGQQYATYERDWDGRPAFDLQMVWTGPQNLPPGFNDTTGSDTPVKLRRPIAASGLAKQVFGQFTNMMFGESSHPTTRILGSEESNDYLQGLIEAARLWAQFSQGRDYGGSTGVAVMGFQMPKGRPPRIEVFNPVYCTPTFVEGREDEHELAALEVRWQVPLEVKLEKGPNRPYQTLYAWRRRVITAERDISFHLVWVGNEIPDRIVKVNGELVFPSGGQEPDWEDPQLLKTVLETGFEEFPGVWIPNLPICDDAFGEGDIDGFHDMIREIDELNSAATYGIRRNAEPWVVFEGCDVPDGLKKGSDHPVSLPEPNSSAKYLEMTGQGAKSAAERVKEIEAAFLNSVQCVLTVESDSGQPATATEIVNRWGPMLGKLARLREQYGEHGVKPLLRKMLQAAKQLDSRGHRVVVPPKVVKVKGEPDTYVDRPVPTDLPESLWIEVKWPRPFKPTLADISAAATAVVSLRTLQPPVIDLDSAVRFLAQFFDFDPDEVLDELERQQLEAELMGGMGGEEEEGESDEGVGAASSAPST